MWGAIAQAGAQLQTAAASNIWSGMQAKKARDFTKKMMQKRHQWEVDDLRKAGLNPILSAGGTPSVGSSAMAQTHPFGLDIEKAIDAGIKAASAKDVIRKKKGEAETEAWRPGQIKATSALQRKMLDNVEAEIALKKAQTAAQGATARKVAADATIQESNIPAAKAKEQMDQTLPGKGLRWLNRTMRSLFGNETRD